MSKWYYDEGPNQQPLIVALPTQPVWEDATPAFRRALADEIESAYNAFNKERRTP